MRKGTLKLLLSSLAAASCAVSLTASTFAYVIIGNSVEVSDFYFDIESQEGLLVSLDGVNYQQDLTSNQVKEKIAGSVTDFDNKSFIGVTPLQEAGHIKYDGTNVMFGYDNASEAHRVHDYENAVANDHYIRFNLWFKALSNTTASSNFNLVLGEKTEIKSETVDVNIYNSFTVGTTDYHSGDKVSQSAKNAIRLGLYSENETTDKFRIYEVTDDKDLGTTAIEGRTDEHSPSSNIMYNYYNVIHPLYPFTSGAEDGEAFDTIKQFGTLNNNVWNGEYVSKFDSDGVAKVTVYLWLEGWDADYLDGTPVEGSKIGATLEFALTK